MTLLLVSALLWIGLHIGVAGTQLRDRVVARTGENGFRLLFSVFSIGVLALLVHAWRAAPATNLWQASGGVGYAVATVMLVASMAFVGSILAKSPTAVGGESAIGLEPRGMLRITRHPMLWSFGLWALVHMVANGDAASLLFFGSFAVTAFAGMPSIDAKVAKRSPAAWPAFAEKTSLVPFAAIAAGRNRLVASEGLLTAALGGLVLWAALIWLHPSAFGVPALPYTP